MSHSEAYSESGFWDKLKQYAQVAGSEVIEKVLCLYYAAQRPETPAWAKTVIFGALGYFIFPLDAVPDVLPALGYGDDLGVIAGALVTVSLYITDEVKQSARDRMTAWFGQKSG
ncbi:MAG: YkvA family protein [Undibacterium umbellatum]|uniref:YkvA family protein n=1 Tax=Undibacterium umbellatum TaxID=2762300 RepID=UPI003BB777E7